MFKAPLGKVFALVTHKEVMKEIVENHRILTPRAKYLFSKIMELSNESIENFEKVRIEKIGEYGILDEHGQKQILADNPNMDKFQREMKELLEVEIEFNVSKIKSEDINVDVKDQFLINWMLEE